MAPEQPIDPPDDWDCSEEEIAEMEAADDARYWDKADEQIDDC
jgi:hypothetical protein